MVPHLQDQRIVQDVVTVPRLRITACAEAGVLVGRDAGKLIQEYALQANRGCIRWHWIGEVYLRDVAYAGFIGDTR